MPRRSFMAVVVLCCAACRPAGDESGRERAFESKDAPASPPAPAPKPVEVRGDAEMAPMPETPDEAALRELSDIRDQMCKCKMPACTEEPGDALYAWGKAHPRGDLPPQLQKRRREISIELANCQVEAMKQAK